LAANVEFVADLIYTEDLHM